jgi:hypothetical protein
MKSLYELRGRFWIADEPQTFQKTVSLADIARFCLTVGGCKIPGRPGGKALAQSMTTHFRERFAEFHSAVCVVNWDRQNVD